MNRRNHLPWLALMAVVACTGSEPPLPGDSTEPTVNALHGEDAHPHVRRLRPSNGKTVAANRLLGASTASDMAAALDLPAGMVVAAQLTSPHPEAAKVLGKFGQIGPNRGDSLVVLSTGLINGGLDHLPEPGTDFEPFGVNGDSVTLRLTLNVPAGANRLFFDYNFLSAESPEYVGANYNDRFTVRITEGAAAPRELNIASVDSSSFFEVSKTNAEGTGFELLFTDAPSGVDSFPANVATGVQIFPDSGLTGPLTANIPLTGAGGKVILEFDIRDAEDGFLDSTVVLDNISISCLEVVDPNAIEEVPDLMENGVITADPVKLSSLGESVRSVAADGVTQVVLRALVPGPGTMRFSLPNERASERGGLARVGGAAWSDQVELNTQLVDGKHYVFALYKSPDDFLTTNSGEYKKARSRPLDLSFEFIPAPGTAAAGFLSTKQVTIVRPPVVVVHDIWSSCAQWEEGDIDGILSPAESNFVDASCADYSKTSSNSLESVENTNVVKMKVDEALSEMRGLPSKETRSHATAVSQVDIVAHGVGGLLARRHVDPVKVNRLITLNTPHEGSLIATALAEMRDKVTPTNRDAINRAIKELGAAGVFIDGHGVNMAVDDLRNDPTRVSDFMKNLDVFRAPSHAVIGGGGRALDYDTSKAMTGDMYRLYLQLETHYSRLLGHSRSGVDKNMVFGPNSRLFLSEHDFFLTETEQRGGMRGGATSSFVLMPPPRDNIDHFHIPRSLAYYARVVELLNSSVHDGAFAPSIPKPVLALPAQGRRDSLAVQEAAFPQVLTDTRVQGGMTIVSPGEGTPVLPGGSVTVVVEPWGGFQPDTLFVTAGRSSAVFEPGQFKGELEIPKEAMGTIELIAFGIDSEGTMLASAPIRLSVNSSARLTSLSVLDGDAFLRVGSTRQLIVSGHYSDGIKRDVSSASQGSTYSSSNAGVATVTADGKVVAVSPGTTTVTIRNGTLFTSISVKVLAVETPSCLQVRLGQYNLFVLEDYLQGHHVEGRVAAGGNISLQDFSVGSALAATDFSQVLTAGGNITLAGGSVWGDVWYGGQLSANNTVRFQRGTQSQGTPINFAARADELRALSTKLAALARNGTTTLYPSWGGIYLSGSSAKVNVFELDSSVFIGANVFSLEAPANSLAIINIRGASATFSNNLGQRFSGGITEKGVLLNFTGAQSLSATGYSFQGTVLAPQARASVNGGGWRGGFYAQSLTGSGAGYLSPLRDTDICQ